MDYEILHTDLLLDGFFTVEKYSLRHALHRGGMGPVMTRYVLHRPDAAAAVVYHTEANALVLVRQFRVGMMSKEHYPWTIELPAGLVDKEESPEECIRREILEETGYKVEKLRTLHMAYPSPGIITERFFLYFTEVDSSMRNSRGGGEPGDEEDIEVVLMNEKRLREAFQNSDIRDAKTLLGIYAAGGLIGWSL